MDGTNFKQGIEEPFFELTGKKIRVEFVDDIKKKIEEIIKSDSQKWSNLYDATDYTGSFIPWADNHCGYILIKTGRNDISTLITAFHEMKHAIDYWMFLNTIFNDDQKKMCDSPLYATFNIYSEFEAVKFGLEQALKILKIERTDKDCQDKCFDVYRKSYIDTTNLRNRQQYLVHSVQYFAAICALRNSFDNFDFGDNVAEIDGALEMIGIFGMLDKNETKNIEWFEKFDSKCRDFIK